MDDDLVAQFTAVTDASAEHAVQYLQVTDGDVSQAIQLFYDAGGIELEPPAPPAPTASQSTDPTPSYEDQHGVVHVDSDDDAPHIPQDLSSRSQVPTQSIQTPASVTPPSGFQTSTVEEDEAMARRLQEELFREPGGAADLGPEDVRAPLARTTETLVGPGSETYDEGHIQAVMAQMRARQQGPSLSSRPGIFNQQPSSSIWNDEDGSGERAGRRQRLSQATGGASEQSSKSNMLAEMYRPPFEIMSRVDFEEGRQQGREQEKWLLVNIQDPAVFDCQCLNRDLWKDAQVRETVRENFVFLQYNKEDPNAAQYIQYYFQAYDTQDSYPHISIVDPRTGEQVKTWTGPPLPKPAEFVMQLHEFLDRYSLKHNVRNPVAKRKPEVKKEKKLDMMTEEEMLEMALQNSLASEAANRHEDPDDLTRSIGDIGKGKGRATNLDDEDMQEAPPLDTNGHVEPAPTPVASPFSSISSANPHQEPAADPTITRIQFRHSGGRVIRRFALADPVQRIYEWLKASPLEGKEGVEFELVFMSKNLMDSLELSIEEAGLKNGTVMVEFIEE